LTELLKFLDLSPYPGDLTPADHACLEHLSLVDPRSFRVGIGEDNEHEDWLPIVERGRDGRWWAGRYIGSLTFEGRRIVIEPRLGIAQVESWLDTAFGLIAPPVSARRVESEDFLVRLLARVWCRGIDGASRHGLPLLRLSRPHEGLFVRGRLDVRRTTALMGEGRGTIASSTTDRSLNHPVSRAIVCADHALATHLTGTAEWRTERVRQAMPHMRAAVGSRPKLPTLHELDRVHYTPITLPFKRAALLSHRIASRLGYGASSEVGQDEGLLVDVAELWELFVLNCVRQASPSGSRVEHGTRAGRPDFFLRSIDGGMEMGRLKPDVIVSAGDTVTAVIDAKYKRFIDTRERPTGVDPADLYQIVAYSMRFKPTASSALVYPCAPGSESHAIAYGERFGPWECEGRTIMFRGVPTDPRGCREAIAGGILGTRTDPPTPAPAAATTTSRV
jgi:5-methylcytosine-specific restriction enzyme subunit McrC